jgi:hypothetical protein
MLPEAAFVLCLKPIALELKLLSELLDRKEIAIVLRIRENCSNANEYTFSSTGIDVSISATVGSTCVGIQKVLPY